MVVIKAKILKKLIRRVLKRATLCIHERRPDASDEEIAGACENTFIRVYNGKSADSLDNLQYQRFISKSILTISK